VAGPGERITKWISNRSAVLSVCRVLVPRGTLLCGCRRGLHDV